MVLNLVLILGITYKLVDKSKITEIEDSDENSSTRGLSVTNLEKVYNTSSRETHALKGISFSVSVGETFVIVGQNGAGKSTLFSILTGITAKTDGYITINGTEMLSISELSQQVGYCSQFDLLWPQLTVDEHVSLYAKIKQIYMSKQTKAELFEKANLTVKRYAQVKSLSGGQRRRLSIILATIGNPRVVCLDEPTTGLDPVNRRLIWKMIREASLEAAVVMSTHSMEEAEVLSSKVGILREGIFVEIDTFDRLKSKFGEEYSFVLIARENKAEECFKFLRENNNLRVIGSEAGHFVVSVSKEKVRKLRFAFKLLNGESDSLFKEAFLRTTSLETIYLQSN